MALFVVLRTLVLWRNFKKYIFDVDKGRAVISDEILRLNLLPLSS